MDFSFGHTVAVVAALIVVLTTATAVYAFLRYGNANARIASLTEQLAEERAANADLRQRLANHKE